MKFLILISVILLPAITFAAAGNPVNHKHGDRYHKHPLPKEGTNHSHSGKQAPSKIYMTRKPDKGWSSVGFTKSYWIYSKNGTYEISKNQAGEVIVTALFNMMSKKTEVIRLHKGYVTKKDCLRGYGTFVLTELSGEYLGETNYAEGTSTLSTGQANVLCNYLKKVKNNSLTSKDHQ